MVCLLYCFLMMKSSSGLPAGLVAAGAHELFVPPARHASAARARFGREARGIAHLAAKEDLGNTACKPAYQHPKTDLVMGYHRKPDLVSIQNSYLWSPTNPLHKLDWICNTWQLTAHQKSGCHNSSLGPHLRSINPIYWLLHLWISTFLIFVIKIKLYFEIRSKLIKI